MSLHIVREPGGYRVSVDPPHAESWESPGLLTASEVLRELGDRGVHSTDLTDALTAADPGWSIAHDEEVRRRRNT